MRNKTLHARLLFWEQQRLIQIRLIDRNKKEYVDNSGQTEQFYSCWKEAQM